MGASLDLCQDRVYSSEMQNARDNCNLLLFNGGLEAGISSQMPRLPCGKLLSRICSVAWGRCGGTSTAGRRHVECLYITRVAYGLDTSDVIVLRCPILSLDYFKENFVFSYSIFIWSLLALRLCFAAFLPGSAGFSLGWRCLLLL